MIITDYAYIDDNSEACRRGFVSTDDIVFLDDDDVKNIDFEKVEIWDYSVHEYDKTSYAEEFMWGYPGPTYDDFGWADDDIYRLVVFDNLETFKKYNPNYEE